MFQHKVYLYYHDSILKNHRDETMCQNLIERFYELTVC